jgi:hypothetical protein
MTAGWGFKKNNAEKSLCWINTVVPCFIRGSSELLTNKASRSFGDDSRVVVVTDKKVAWIVHASSSVAPGQLRYSPCLESAFFRGLLFRKSNTKRFTWQTIDGRETFVWIKKILEGLKKKIDLVDDNVKEMIVSLSSGSSNVVIVVFFLWKQELAGTRPNSSVGQ